MEKEATEILNIRIPVTLKRELESCAQDADLSSSQVVRKLIRDYVAKNYKGDLFLELKKEKKSKN